MAKTTAIRNLIVAGIVEYRITILICKGKVNEMETKDFLTNENGKCYGGYGLKGKTYPLCRYKKQPCKYFAELPDKTYECVFPDTTHYHSIATKSDLDYYHDYIGIIRHSQSEQIGNASTDNKRKGE